MTHTLPVVVKELFPTENLEFSQSITEAESKVLKEVFQTHSCFDQCGEMITAVGAKDAALGDRLNHVLEENKKRLQGLSPTAVEYAKNIITMVVHVLCSLTLGKTVSDVEAKKLKEAFQKLSDTDRAALVANNKDIKFD